MYFTSGCLSSQAVVRLSCNAVSLFYGLQLWFNVSLIVLFKHSMRVKNHATANPNIWLLYYTGQMTCTGCNRSPSVVINFKWRRLWQLSLEKKKLVSSNSPLKLSWTEDASWPENFFSRLCMVVLSIFTPRICYIALNLSYSGHSHVGLLSLLRTKIRTKRGHDATKYKEHTLAVLQWFIFFSFLFHLVKQDQERFLQFFLNQTIPW